MCCHYVYRDYCKSPDTLKPILFVEYENSCIDLYLCGLNIKHICVLKKKENMQLMCGCLISQKKNINGKKKGFQDQIYCF